MDLNLSDKESQGATQSRALTGYSEDELLMLSGIQHISFCKRQWALIHIEQQWAENVLTVEGHFLHERVDDPFAGDKRVNTITSRSVPLVSHTLGLYGKADVVEYLRDDKEGIELKGHQGKWLPVPVEYKRGKPKPDERDEVQLCAQAICLEEMHGTNIAKGALYYGETRHRHEVCFDETLRKKVMEYAQIMHDYFDRGYTPPAEYKPHYKSCSLVNICMPESFGHPTDVNQYLLKQLDLE